MRNLSVIINKKERIQNKAKVPRCKNVKPLINFHLVQTHGVYGGANTGSTFHGHGGRSDEVEIDREKYFRHVDRFVLEHISKNVKLPLLLVAHNEHQTDFRKLSNNPYLLEDRIEGSYGDFDETDLTDQIMKVGDRRFEAVIHQALEHYHNVRDKEMSTDQLILVLKALLSSRVETLFIEKNKIIPGKIDVEKQQIITSELDDPETDDLLDDMIEHAYRKGTKVYILEKEFMPTTSGVVTTFRY